MALAGTALRFPKSKHPQVPGNTKAPAEVAGAFTAEIEDQASLIAAFSAWPLAA